MPRSTIPVGDAIETAALGRAGRASSHPVAFELGEKSRHPLCSHFGTQSRGLHARCLRFEIPVTRVLPYDLARLASGVAVSVVAGGIFTPGHASKFRLLHAFLSDQACPGALAKGLNRMMGRSGRVFDDRYHARVLRTPTEVRHAIHYVLENARKHAAERGETYAPGYVDPYSSAGAPDLALPPAQTWLLRVGWKRGGP
jgi:hypothetical protein